VSEHVSLRLALLDKQIVDRERLPIGRVDDLELVLSGSGEAPQTEAILRSPTGSPLFGSQCLQAVSLHTSARLPMG